MTRGTAIYSGEELEVEFSCGWDRCDYGVPRSPVWYEPTDIQVEGVTLLGQFLDFNKLSENMQTEIYNLHGELDFD